MRDDGIVPLICPTCQNVFAGVRSEHRPRCYFAWGCFRYFSWERERRSALRLGSVACRAVARGGSPPSPKRASARQPSLASRAKAGGPGRTRTCNQTVMSGSADYSIVDFLQLLAAINCIRSRSDRSFLVRNWCGSSRRGSSQWSATSKYPSEFPHFSIRTSVSGSIGPSPRCAPAAARAPGASLPAAWAVVYEKVAEWIAIEA